MLKGQRHTNLPSEYRYGINPASTAEVTIMYQSGAEGASARCGGLAWSLELDPQLLTALSRPHP